jgi:ribosomal-protein-alanine N-acetyltransferase
VFVQTVTTGHHFPALQTERLLLRPLSGDDLDFVFQHFADPEVSRYLLDEEPLTTREQAQAIIDSYVPSAGRSRNRWVITRKSVARAIGTCGYHNWQQQHHHAEIGFDLEKASWHQGYMTEALRAALEYGFEQMGLNRVEAVVYPENDASMRVLQRLGFQTEGLLRQYCRQGGTYYDHWLLSLLKAEWSSR